MTQGGTATFKYDPFGRRIQKVFTQNSTTTTTNYLYDGDNAIETVDQNGSVVAKYAQGQNIDEPLAESVGGTTYDYEQDGLGSATSLTNSSGALALTNTYDNFGKITASSGSVTNPFRYTGRDFDSETGLYYYRARYYDPQVGRLMSEDPIEFDGGADFYAYSDNDPVLYTDASGLIHYNAPPPRTVPPTGKTLQALNCLEHCLQCVTHNPDLNLLVTGGSEQSGHTRHSYHYLGQAVDIAGPYFNPVGTRDVYACGEQCGFTAGQFETFPANPFRNHWHLQITPGNGVPLLPPLLPVAPRPQR